MQVFRKHKIDKRERTILIALGLVIGLSLVVLASTVILMAHNYRLFVAAEERDIRNDETLRTILIKADQQHTLLWRAISDRDTSSLFAYRELARQSDSMLTRLDDVSWPDIAGSFARIHAASDSLVGFQNQVVSEIEKGDFTGAASLIAKFESFRVREGFRQAVRTADDVAERALNRLTPEFKSRVSQASVLFAVLMLVLGVLWIIMLGVLRAHFAVRREMEASLRESEIRYRTLADALPLAVVIIQEGRVVYANDAVVAMGRYASPEDLIGGSAFELTAPAERERLRAYYAARLQNQPNIPDHYVSTGLRKNGEEFPVELNVRKFELNGRDAIIVIVADISERREAEEALRESEERFRNLADTAPVLIWMAGVKRHTFYFNRGWLKFTGQSLAEAYGMGWTAHVHPDDLSRCLETYETAFQAQRGFTVEYRLRNADGIYRTFLDVGVPRFTKSGGFSGYIGTCTDITDRLEAETSLREKERELATLLGNVPGMAYRCHNDSQWTMEVVSEGCYALTGYRPADFIANRRIAYNEVIHPEDRDKVWTDVQEALRERRQFHLTYRIVTAAGEVRWVSEYGRGVFNAIGELDALEGLITDVTSFKQLEQQLRSQSSVISQIHNALISTDLNGIITEWNKGAERIYGYSADEAIGRSVEMLYPNPMNLQRQVIEPLMEKGVHDVEVTLRRKSGEDFSALLSLTILRNDDGTSYGFNGYSTDITRLKLIEEDLRLSEQRLRSVIDNAPFGAHLYELRDNGDLILIGANNAANKILGIDHAPLFGSTIETAFPGLKDTEIPAIYRRVAQSGTPYFAQDVHYEAQQISGVYEINAVSTGIQHMAVFFRDVTELKKAETALRTESDLVAQIMDTSPVGICVVDKSGVVSFANSRAEQILALPRGDTVPIRYNDSHWRITALDGTPFPDDNLPFAQVMRSGKPVDDVRHAIAHPDGRQIALSVNASPLIDETGAITGMVATLTDISNRLKAEQALRDSEERFRRIFEMGPMGMVVSGSDARFIRANEALCRFLGYSEAELTHMSFRDITPPKRVGEDADAVMKLYRGEIPVYRTTKEYLRKDGTVVWGNLTTTAVRDENGQFLYFLAMVEDITERKRAEEALSQSEVLYHSLFENMLNGMAYCRMIFEEGRPADFIYLDVNDAFEKLTGLKNVVGKKVSEVIPGIRESDPQLIETYGRVAQTGSPERFEIFVSALEMWFSISVYCPEKEHFVALFDVVTERKRAEEALRNSERLLLQSQAVAGIGSYVFDIRANRWTSSPVLDKIFGIDADFVRSAEGWISFVHPEYRDAMMNHLMVDVIEKRGRFDKEYKIVRVNDHAVLWVHGLGELDLDAQGNPLRMVGTIQDITERKRVESAVTALVTGGSAQLGTQFFETMTVQIADILQADHAYIAELIRNGTAIRTISLCSDGRISNNIEYELTGTPCAEVLLSGPRSFDRDITRKFPDDPLLKDLGLESYVGVPLLDSNGSAMGIMVALFRNPVSDPRFAETILQLFAARTAAEIERSRIENAQRESEERFRLTFQTSPDAININRMSDGMYIDVNDGFTTLTGYRREEVIGRTSIETNIWVDLEDRSRLMNALAESGYCKNLEARFRLKNGEIRWGLMSARLVSMDNQMCILTVVRDIEELRRAADTLREREQRLSSILRAAPVGIGVVTNRIFSEINETVCDMTGYAAADLLGKSSRMLYPSDEEFEMVGREKYRQIRQYGVGSVETVWRRKNGSLSNILLSSSPLDSADPSKGVTFTALDITERKRAEEALRLSEERYRGVFDAVFDVIIYSQNGVIVDFSDKLPHMFGYEKSEFVGMPISNLVVHDDRPRVKSNILSGYDKPYEVTCLRKDGTVFPVEMAGRTIVSREGVGRVSAMRDITDRKRFEEELARRADELERSNAELERFAYVASHDLQEPLRMMASYAELLNKRYHSALDQDGKEFIGYIVEGADRMQQLIRDLLAFSRMDTAARRCDSTDFNKILERAAGNLQAAIAESGAAITSDALPVVHGDQALLVQLMQNLIGNAIKFRGENPPHIHVSAADSGDSWLFSVRDNGIGIDPKYFDRIFVLFRRLHGRGEYPGTGIGLAICKKILERHGGRIWVESETNKGSTFYFSIPKHKTSRRMSDHGDASTA